MNDQTRLQFYASAPETCSYLPDRQSVSAFANPHIDMDMQTYNELIQLGFRRSGGYLYRPHCPNCEQCISTRIPVQTYRFSRNDKRIMRRNSDLQIRQRDGRYIEQHFELYRRYINSRHSGGSMNNPSKSDYHRFLICDWTDSAFIEFWLDNKLLAVAVTDITSSGHSAVYTFYDPEQKARSLGHFAILKQIEISQQQCLPYLYLGYWIKDCRKMSYKARYRPAEGFVNNNWVEFDRR